MNDTVRIEWDDRAWLASVARLRELTADLSPLMADIAEGLLQSTWDRFDEKVSPDGVPWAPLAPSTLALKKGPGILEETGNLRRDSLHHSWSADFAEIASSAPYARWHQEGTDPYVIEPKPGKKALAIPGADGEQSFRRKVNHPGLKARPFIGVSQADREMIDDATRAALERAAEGSGGGG